jgi:hypothetical protein
LKGIWNEGAKSCTIPAGNTGTVPSGDDVFLQELYNIVVSAGATLNVNGWIWLQPGEIDNSGVLNIGSGGQITVYGLTGTWANPGFLINAGTLTNNGKLVVGASTVAGHLDRDGVLYNCGTGYAVCTGTGTIINNGTIDNSSENFSNCGDFTNNATINTYHDGEISNSGSFTNNSRLYVHGLLFQGVGGSFTNASGGLIQLWSHNPPDLGRLQSFGGSFVNNGEILIASTDTDCWIDLVSFTNNSVVESWGSFTVNNMTNAMGANFYNRGHFTVDVTGTLTNNGNFNSSATVSVAGTINNYASFYNNGGTLDVQQQGEITNWTSGSLKNGGAITMGQSSRITNHGTFDTYSGSTIMIPSNAYGLSNDGTIEHRGSLTSYTTIYNYIGATDGVINKHCGSVITLLENGSIYGGTVNDLCVGTVIINKTAVGDNATFSYTGSGTGIPSSFTIATTGGAGSRTFSNIAADQIKTVTESLPPTGWEFTSVSCSDPDGGSTVDQGTRTVTIDLDQGETITCTFTNTRQTGTIEVKKVLSPSGDPGRFNLRIDGTTKAQNVGDGGTTGAITVGTGSHTVSETAYGSTSLSDYTITYVCTRNGTQFASGSGESVPSFTVDDGDTVVCTFTNERKGTIEVKKALDPSSDPGRFNLLIDGTTEASNVGNGGTTGAITVGAGSHAVSETAYSGTSLADYTTTYSWSRNGGTPTTGSGTSVSSITVNDGDTIVCTFTNTRKTGTIEVKKVLDPSSDPGTFDLLIDGATKASDVGNGGTTGAIPVVTGSHSVSETICSGGTDLTDYTVTYSWNCNGGSPTTGSGSSVSITVNEGDTIVCTFTNTRNTGTIEVKKVLSPSSDPGRFDLLIDGTTKASNVGNGGTTGAITVVTGGHSVSESAYSGTSLSDYATTYSWSRNGGTLTTGSGTSVSSITVYDGDTIVCTFTNERKGTIVIEKATEPSGGAGFDFTDDIEAPNAFALNDGETKTFLNVAPGTYTVTEADPMGTPGDYNLTALVCVEDQVNNSTENLGSRQATIRLDPGETVTCTFTNRRRPYVKGDVNGDGFVDLIDVRMCHQIATHFRTGTPLEQDAADVDSDGDVDMDDVTILSQYVLGIRTTFP